MRSDVTNKQWATSTGHQEKNGKKDLLPSRQRRRTTTINMAALSRPALISLSDQRRLQDGRHCRHINPIKLLQLVVELGFSRGKSDRIAGQRLWSKLNVDQFQSDVEIGFWIRPLRWWGSKRQRMAPWQPRGWQPRIWGCWPHSSTLIGNLMSRQIPRWCCLDWCWFWKGSSTFTSIIPVVPERASSTPSSISWSIG